MEGTEVDPKLLQYAAHSESTYEIARQVKDIKEDEGGIKVLIEWEGLPDQTDFTWEPLMTVYQDIAALLEDFLCTTGNRRLKKKVQAMLFDKEDN